MSIENSKLAELIGSLTPAELKRLENFIFSPYFNNSEQITLLFKLIQKSYPDFKGLTKELIFKAIYPKENYKDKKVRDLLSRMLKLTEDFFAQEEFLKKPMLKTVFALQQLAARNMEKHFAGKAREADTDIKKEKVISSDLLFNKYSVFREEREYFSALRGKKKLALYYGDITTEIDLFIAFAVHNILKFEIIILANKKEIKYSHEFKILESILGFCRQNPMEQYPVIMIFYYIIMLSRNDDMETYIKLKNLIDNNIDSISEKDKIIILVEQFNFTKVQALKGIDFYRKENYRILKQNTDSGIYPTEGKYFADSSYVMIAVTAFQQKDFGWAEDFMNKYKDKLDPKKKENAYTYLQGVLNYRKGNYGAALNCLARVSTDDFAYYWRVKNNQLKIYFETGDYESVLRTADSYRHFLSTTRHMPDYEKTRFVNFVNFLSRVANALLSENTDNIIDIRNEIVNFDQVKLESKIWLLEQLNKINL